MMLGFLKRGVMTKEKETEEKEGKEEKETGTETRGRKKLCDVTVLYGTIRYKGNNYGKGETFKAKKEEAEELFKLGVAQYVSHD